MKRKQVLLNISANFLSVLITLIISFFLTPYIVTSIGKEGYSFVPISNNFTSYLTIITSALTSMTARFVTLKIHKGEVQSANEYLSTSFYVNLILSAIIAVFSVVIVVFLDKIVNIPPNILMDVRLLFAITFVSFIISVSTSVFHIAAFCSNRLDVTSVISIIGSLARILVIAVLFRYFSPHIYYVGLSVLSVTLVFGIFNYITSRKLMPMLRIRFKDVKMKLIGELFSSGVWNAFNQLSSVLLTGLDLTIANIMVSASASGTLAVAKTAPMALQTLVSVVPLAFNPYLTILYAKGNREVFLTELLYTLKFNAIIVAIPIAGFIALASQFFALWVPNLQNFEITTLAILTMISLVASFSVLPLFNIFTITNKLKRPSYAIFLTGLLNVIIVIFLIRTTDWDIYALAGVSSFLEIFRCLIFVPIYAAHCLQEKKSLFYPSIFASLAYMSILILAFVGIAWWMPATSWVRLIFSAGTMTLTGVLIGLIFFLNQQEKNQLIKKLIYRNK